MDKLISLQQAIDALRATQTYKLFAGDDMLLIDQAEAQTELMMLPSAQPERLTDDDFETIRIHLNAYKEKLCNQQRWKEADEYQRIIGRFMAFASAQSEKRTEERTETHACDCISRQAAIDALHCHFADGFEEDRWWNSTHVIAALKGLPAVQSEQVAMIKEIRKWINSKNRGNADYFIVDRIEEIINKYE